MAKRVSVTAVIGLAFALMLAACADILGVVPLSSTCGNGTREAGEQCDDGNSVANDGCFECQRECGNGRVDGKEECDDGNGDNNDECSERCTLCMHPSPTTLSAVSLGVADIQFASDCRAFLSTIVNGPDSVYAVDALGNISAFSFSGSSADINAISLGPADGLVYIGTHRLAASESRRARICRQF